MEEPLKIQWQGRARERVRRALKAAEEDEWEERAVALNCFKRQKTQIVVKTEEEREALLAELANFRGSSRWGRGTGYAANGCSAIERVREELFE